jgi:flagellar hook-associated protein 3 FlgL
MRISTAQIYQGSLNAMLDNQSSLSHTQLQMSTGRRILTPSDDPVGSAAVLDLNQAIDNTHQYQANADVAIGRLQLGESTLGDVGNLLQRVRELTVQANNDTQTSETRRYIATELRQLRSQLIGLANTRDATGEYLFAGFKGNTQPFVPNSAGQVTYVGDPGSRYLQVGPGQQVVDGEPGSAVFMGIRNGNGTFSTLDNPANTGSGIIVPGTVVNPGAYVADTFQIQFTSATTYDVVDTTTATTILAAQTYTDGAAISFNGIQVMISGQPGATDSFTVSPSANQDVFSTVQNIITALETYQNTPVGNSAMHNAVNRGMVDIDQAMGSMLDARARAGARLNTLDGQKSANDAFLLLAQQSLSNVQDLDYAEAASRLNQQLLALQATQQTFVKVQGLSLFNYLR